MPAIASLDAVLVEPPAGAWRSLSSSPSTGRIAGDDIAGWRRRTRRALDLPVDRIIVATGHQPVPRHPGVFAKYLALRQIAAAVDAESFDLVIDSHRGDAGAFDVPVHGTDGMLSARSLRYAVSEPEIPLCWQPPVTCAPPEPPSRAAGAAVRAGIERVATAVSVARGATLALQLHDVERRLARRFDAAPPPITATALLQTELGAALVAAMASDPRACVDAHDAAVAAHPEAGVRRLADAGADQLPLWIEQADGRVRAATIDDLAGDDLCPGGRRLLPRALLTTALVRLAACDLFIHGTGGAAYDAVMEAWLARWLDVEPAPRCTVSATLRLPLLPEGWAARRRAEVIDLARHRWHDPDAFTPLAAADVRPPSAIKRAALSAISAGGRRSAERHEAFRAMHQHQAQARREAGLASAPTPEITQAISATSLLAGSRAWSHSLHADSALATLRTSLAGELFPVHPTPA